MYHSGAGYAYWESDSKWGGLFKLLRGGVLGDGTLAACFGAGDGRLEILSKATIAEPGEGALHQPAGAVRV